MSYRQGALALSNYRGLLGVVKIQQIGPAITMGIDWRLLVVRFGNEILWRKCQPF